jgi:hypothetical protein
MDEKHQLIRSKDIITMINDFSPEAIGCPGEISNNNFYFN